MSASGRGGLRGARAAAACARLTCAVVHGGSAVTGLLVGSHCCWLSRLTASAACWLRRALVVPQDRISLAYPQARAAQRESNRVSVGNTLAMSTGHDSGPNLPWLGQSDCQGPGRVPTGFVGAYGAECAAVQGHPAGSHGKRRHSRVTLFRLHPHAPGRHAGSGPGLHHRGQETTTHR